jgi:hypothetical protein
MIANISEIFPYVGFLFLFACCMVGAGTILRGAFAAVLFAWRRRTEQDAFVRQEALESWSERRQG